MAVSLVSRAASGPDRQLRVSATQHMNIFDITLLVSSYCVDNVNIKHKFSHIASLTANAMESLTRKPTLFKYLNTNVAFLVTQYDNHQ